MAPASLVRRFRWFIASGFLLVAGLPLGAASFTSSQNGNWSASSTWGGAGVPGAGDTASIGNTVTLDVPVTVATLTLTGTLTGPQPVSVTSAFNWNGGTQSGSGTTTIPSGSVMTLGSYGTLDGRTVSLAGTLNMTGSFYFYMQNNASIANSGTIDFQGDGGIYVNGTTGTIAITNTGTIKKSGGTFTSTLTVPLIAQSGSQFLVQSGNFNVAAVAATGATFDASSGTTLNFNTADTRTFDGTSTLSGAGTVQWSAGTNTVSGTYNVTGATNGYGATTTIAAPTSTGALSVNSGTLTLNGAGTLSVPTLAISGGTLTGTAPITFTSTPMSWTGGSISGSGLVTIPAATTVNATGTFLDGRAFANSGTISLTTGYIYMQNNATLTNSGTIDFAGDGSLYINGTVGSTAVTNSGTIKKSAGSSSSVLNVPLIMQSGSQMLAQAAILYLGPVAATNATVSVSSGASLYFYYGSTSTFDATSSISGAGNVQWASGTNTINANYNVTGVTSCNGGTTTLNNITSVGALTVSSGALTLNSGSTLTVPTLTISGGVLNGTAPISVTSATMTWSGGTIGGSGLLSIPGGTAVSLSGLVLDTRQLSNSGTINLVSNGALYLQNNATIANSGTIDLQGDASIYLNSALGSIGITNGGTIKKSAGASSSTINVPIVLQSGSQFLQQAATLYLDAVTATSATVGVSGGATLYFYYNAVRSFDAATTISGAGSVWWYGGTNTVNAAYNISGTTSSSGGTTTVNNITGLGPVNVPGGTLTLNSMPGIGSVTVSGGTLTLNNGSTLTFPTLTMSGGILNGTAPISVTAAAMTWSGGTIGGSGLLSIPLGTTVSLSSLVLDTRQLSNAGTINVIGSGSLYMQNNATLTNSGTIDLQSDGNIFLNSALGSIAITNNGTLKKSGGATSSTINVPIVLQSGSQLLNQAVILYLGAVTATSATVNVSSGATLYFYYGGNSSFDAASTISGPGNVQWAAATNTVNGAYNVTGTTFSSGGASTLNNITGLGALNVSGGTLTLNGASALSVSTLTISGGTLNGTAPVNLTAAAMTWTGGIIGGSGTLGIPAATTITLSDVFLDTRPVTNAGKMNVVSNGYLYLQNNAVLTNSGTIDLQGDSSVYLNSVAGTTAVVNSGTIKKSAGTSVSNFNVALTAQSGAQFLVQSGTVYADAITSTGAAFTVSSGATLTFYYGGNRTFDAASTISGAGLTQMQGGTATINGTLSTPLNISGGTVTINSAATQTIPTLTMAGGTFNGTSNVNLSGAAMTWTGGIIGGSGTLAIPGGTVITLNGYPTFDSRPITNNGTINFTATNYIYVQNNSVLTNNGTIDMQNDAAMYLNGTAGSTAVVNNGTIKKSGGTGTSYFLVPLTAQSGSQFLVQTGTMAVGAITATSATFNAAAGTTLYCYTGDVRTFDAASSISGSGALLAQAGTVTVSGTLTLATTVSAGTLTVNSAAAQTLPLLAMTGGTLNGTGSVSVSGTSMTWTGGIISGSGVLTIASGTTVNITGYPQFDTRPITNNGTVNLTSTNYVYMLNNAVLTNNGTLDFQSDGNVYLNSALGTTAIVNNGTFRKSGGINTSAIGIPFTNNAAGTLQASSGTIQLQAGLTSSGVLSFVVASATVFGKMTVTGALPLAGTLAATTTGGYTPPNGTTFQVLTYSSTSAAFSQKNLTYPSGQFTDSATSTALTLTAGPSTCLTPPSGIVSWWRGEGNAVDSIGVNNGTLTGGATTSIGYVSSALTFNGTSAYVTVPDLATLHLPSLSVEGWVKFSTVGGPAIVASKPVGGGTANSFQIYYDGSGHLGAAIGDGAGANANVQGTWTPTTGVWQHVAMTFDGPSQLLTIYLDGAPAGSGTTGKTPVYDSSALLIGAESDPALTSFFAGSIDELTLYNRALTPTEVANIFNSGNAGKCFSVLAPTIGGFTPLNGPVGTSVAITGTNLIGTSAVSFNGTPASSYTVNSATQVTAVVATGSTTGPISLTTAGGTATSAGSFTVGLPPADVSPSFASVPASATAGTPFNAALGATNAGPNPATSVTYNVTVTGGTINSITASPLWTSCSSSATTITCSATSLAASTTAPVSVNATAPSAGTLTFSATTGAANDTVPGNDTGSASVTIIPPCTTPSAAITAPSTACPNATGLNASVTVTSGATYAWTISNGVITAGQGTNAITFSAGATGTVILGVVVTNGTCSNSGNQPVPIAAPATPTITPSGSVTVCGSNSTTLIANATGATSYAWFKNGNPLGITTPSLTVNAAGSYSVTVSYGSCSATSAPTTVTVATAPSPAITAPPSLCPGSSGNASTPLVAGTTYAWSINNGAITTGQSTNAITFTAGTGNVALFVTVTNASCSGSASASVPLNPAPSAAIATPAIACANSTVTASVTSQAGATYAWALAGVPISGGQGTPAITFTAPSSGSVAIDVTVVHGGCSSHGSAVVSAAPSSVAISVPPNVAAGSTNNIATATTIAGATYAWSVTNGAITGGQSTSTVSFTAGSSGSVTLNVTATLSACAATGTASIPITVTQPTCGSTPAALLSPGDGAFVTSPATFSWSAVDDASAYEVWTSPDGAPAAIAGTTAATSLTTAVSGNAVEWYVVARFDNGCPALVSAHRSFQVTAATSCQSHIAPVLTAPFNTSTASPVTFTWLGSPEAVGYEVWITVDGAAAQDIGTTSGATTLTATIPPGNIAWFVDALFAGCPPLRSGTFTFTVPTPDPCANRATAQLVAPADNATHPASSVAFQWTTVANAGGYRVWTAIDGAAFVALGTTGDTTLHAVMTTGSVEWYVETLFNGCASTESQHRTFVIPQGANCGADGQPAGLSPQSDTTNPSVTFGWTALQNATSYEVWLALGGGSPALLGVTTQTSLTHDVPAGALEWFVRAHFDGCPVTESQHAHFSYVSAVQCIDARPLLVAPLNGTTGVYVPVSFSWKGVAGATSYKLWISNNEGAFTTFATAPATHLDNAPVPDGTIDWYVEALTNGCPPAASTPSRFTVVAEPSGCPALIAPVMIAPGAASSAVQYTIRWQRVAGATSYIVESADDLGFSAPSVVSTEDDHYDFTNVNDGNTPLSIFFRVRALESCQAQPGPYSTAVAVVILPSHPEGNNLQGAISADAAQTITYTIPLDASLAGLAFTATPNQPFLTVTPSSGTVPPGGLNLTVTAGTSDLAIGTTLGGITITTSTPSSSGHLTVNGGTTSTTTISVSLVSPVQPAPKSTPPPDALIIPAVAHAGGINSTFQSDVRVTNASPQVMKYQVTFTPTGDSGISDSKQTTIDINPGNTIALDDILGTWFNNTSGTAIGTLEIRPLSTQSTSTSPSITTVAPVSTFASSRTFDVTANGTFGQYIPAIPFSTFIGLSKDPNLPAILSLQQIAQSSAFRTNLGIVEGSGQPASVLISVFGDDGSKVAEFPLELAGGQHTQFSLASKNVDNVTDGRVEVRVLSPGGKVTAYASVLDNLTNDPLLVSPVNRSAAGNTTYVVPGVANLNNGFASWRTDMRLFNASASAVDATLTYYSQGGGDPKSVTVTLPPNEVKEFDDTLASTFGVTNDGGAVHITTATAANLIATARTFNQTGNGTYGQFIPAVTPLDAAGAGSRPLQVLQLEESDRFRSNVGLAEVTGKPATVLVSVAMPDSKVIGNVQIDLAPNEFRQFNSLLKSFGSGSLYNARVAVKVISGDGRVTAYASVIDALTQDPTFIPAQ